MVGYRYWSSTSFCLSCEGLTLMKFFKMQKQHFLTIILLTSTRYVSSQGAFGSFGGEALSGFSPGLFNRNRARPTDQAGTVVQGGGVSDLVAQGSVRPDAMSSALNIPGPQRGLSGAVNTNFTGGTSNMAGPMGSFNMGSRLTNSISGNDNTSGGLDSTGGKSGYGNGYGGDDDGGSDSSGGGGPNAGYGGYPGRGGYSGYWEPGVKPVPLAMQGWGLYLPRPPVEITTPVTVATRSTARYAYAYATAAPTTIPPTTTTTRTTTTTTSTTTTARPYTAAPPPAPTTATTTRYVVPTPSNYFYNSNLGNIGSSSVKGPPQVFMIDGQRVLMMPVNVDPNQGGVADRFSQVPPQPVRAPVDGPSGPPTCIPASSPSAKGTCVADTDLQINCSNMIIANSDTCAFDQFCCFAE